MDTTEIFSRRARRAARDRASRSLADDKWLMDRMAQDVCDRLDALTVKPERVLTIGLGAANTIVSHLKRPGRQIFVCDSSFQLARSLGGVQCDEDRLPFRDSSFDLVLCCGSLDTVNDLPGALILIRRILRPNAPLIGSFLGLTSLSALKKALLAADLAMTGDAGAHIHPQIDVRSMGDLLMRAGYSMPVVDVDRFDAKYPNAKRLVQDVRAIGGQNVLIGRRSLSRKKWQHVERIFLGAETPIPAIETFSMINFTAWSPAPNEHRPAGPKRTKTLESR
jgi:SAM-dependent methyltransferase